MKKPAPQKETVGRAAGRYFSRCPMRCTVVGAFVIAWLFAPCAGQSLVEPPYLHTFGMRKATAPTLFLFVGPATEFDDPQGIATAKMKSRDDPKTASDDDEVVVYGVNAGRHQLIYNTSMWTIGLYGSKGSGDGQFDSPAGIAVDADGNVYVADCGNNRIAHLFNPKRDVRWVGSFTGRNKNDGGLSGPCRVALDNSGRIFVSDSGNRRVAVFTADGTIQEALDGRGKYRFEQGPTMLAVADGSDPNCFFRGEKIVYCADRGGARLWKIDFGGAVQKQAILPAGYHAAYGAVDYYSSLWVTDTQKHCILKYDHNLNLLDIFGSYGDGKGQFEEPRGIAIWKKFGQTFVAEKHGAQYYWIGTDCTAKALRKVRDNNYTLSLALTEYSFISVFVTQRDTSWLVKSLMAYPPAAIVPLVDAGAAIASGKTVVLRVEPTYSSYTYFKQEFPLSITK